jgi:ethanolamine utilization protein EutN
VKLGIVTGKVWATVKDPQLEGVKLFIIQPIDEHKNPVGKEIVAVDTYGAREDDVVFWVGGREATRGIEGRLFPSDATILGLADRLDVKEEI